MKESHEVINQIDNALACVSELCSGKRRWVMSVPVREDDPDIMLSRALREARKYIIWMETNA